MYLVDFTAAHFYNTALAGEGLEKLLGRPLTQVEALYDPRHANSASAAVLRDDLPTLPADEACAIIYTAMQVNFPDSLVNTPLASDNAIDVKIWPQTRDLWRMQWYECTDDTITSHVNTIVTSLSELEKHRADPAYILRKINEVVLDAVEAVYGLKNAVEASRTAKDIVAVDVDVKDFDHYDEHNYHDSAMDVEENVHGVSVNHQHHSHKRPRSTSSPLSFN